MTDRIERELLVEASPTEVWTVVTGPGWLATEVEIDPVPGGEARFRSGEELRSGWIEEIRPPDGTYGSTARLVFWWAAGEEPASRVELTVECAGEDCTLVRVVEARPSARRSARSRAGYARSRLCDRLRHRLRELLPGDS